MMNIYVVNAGGMYAIGTAVVAAPTHAIAVQVANEASERKWNLTYHGMQHREAVGVCDENEPRVMSIHEWGMPDLPSKGSGIKVAF
jgi:hypothetical protein